jgi:DNA-binding MarR family transcriptional regulator
MAQGDLSEVPTEELVRLAKRVTESRRKQEQEAEAATKRQGAVIAELVRRPGWTYAKVAELLGIDDSTAHRLVRRAQE